MDLKLIIFEIEFNYVIKQKLHITYISVINNSAYKSLCVYGANQRAGSTF